MNNLWLIKQNLWNNTICEISYSNRTWICFSMTKFWLLFPYNFTLVIFAQFFFNLQLLPFGYIRFFFLFHKQWIGYWLFTTWQNWFKSLPVLCDQSQVVLILHVIKHWVSLGVHVHQTHHYILCQKNYFDWLYNFYVRVE